MAHGEYWIAKEIYRRELARLISITAEQDRTEAYHIIISWLQTRIDELEKLCKG